LILNVWALAAGALLSLAVSTGSTEPPPGAKAPGQAAQDNPVPVTAPAGQPPAAIQWMDWSEKAFVRATTEGKPILLNVRALWSRASLWSEEVNFGDPDIVKLVNEQWVPIRVDRDRRPDIDMRYQLAVNAAFPGEAGWPMTAFLLDSGDVIFGTSAISLKDRRGKPGLVTMLSKAAENYNTFKERAGGMRHVVNQAFQRELSAERPAEYSLAYLEGITKDMIDKLDADHGGYGETGRVPMLYTLELAGTVYHRVPRQELLDVLVKSLQGMERGAIFDRVGGGFHRGVTDNAWRVPEFEKLLSYNAGLIDDYLMGYELTNDPELRFAAESSIDFLLGTLKDPQGGFYLGQWAASRSDEPRGLYYAWTDEEFAKAVPPEHQRLARLLFNVRPEGDLVLGPPARSLLYLAMTRKEAAERLGSTVDAVRKDEKQIVAALARARATRAAPPIEKAIYVDSSASAVLAMLEAWRVLGRADARDAGVAALDRLIAAIPSGGPLLHRVAPPPEPGIDPPLAMDHMMLARACLAGYEVLEDPRYLAAARDLVDRANKMFWDPDGGGYFDIASDPAAKGYLSIRRRLPNDTAYPPLNSLAARVLARLTMLTGEAGYRERGDICLKQLVAQSKELNYRMGGLGLALDTYLRAPVRYIVVGAREDPKAETLRAAAFHVFDPGKLVQRLVPGRDDEAIARLKVRKSSAPVVVICSGDKCSDPLKDEASLKERVARAKEPAGKGR